MLNSSILNVTRFLDAARKTGNRDENERACHFEVTLAHTRRGLIPSRRQSPDLSAWGERAYSQRALQSANSISALAKL